jgi:hypothetical protein
VRRQEAGVRCPHCFCHARVGGDGGVWPVCRREKEGIAAGADYDRRVPHDFGVDRSVTAKHCVRRGLIREERGGRGSATVSRTEVGSIPGARVGDRVLPEGRTGKTIGGRFRIQCLQPHRWRLAEEEGYITTFNRADGAGVCINKRIRR